MNQSSSPLSILSLKATQMVKDAVGERGDWESAMEVVVRAMEIVETFSKVKGLEKARIVRDALMTEEVSKLLPTNVAQQLKILNDQEALFSLMSVICGVAKRRFGMNLADGLVARMFKNGCGCCGPSSSPPKIKT